MNRIHSADGPRTVRERRVFACARATGCHIEKNHSLAEARDETNIALRFVVRERRFGALLHMLT
jgi:hypothetical protein